MTQPSYYTPRTPSALDTVGYTQRVVDAILRNNPLHNAAVDSGLMKWFGNYQNTNGDTINYLWIGEFFPADPNLPGSPPQKGISMVRDDSRGGQSAFALYDHAPNSGDGLRQTIHVGSGDGHQMFMEAREGGQEWPRNDISMYARDSDLALWPGTDAASFSAIYEGQVSIVGRFIRFRMWDACTGGAVGRFRLRVVDATGVNPDIISTIHDLPANANGVFDSEVNVAVLRGGNATVFWEAARTNGVGKARTVPISITCYS